MTQNHSNFKRLTNETAITFAKKLGLVNADASLNCKEIGDGNLNYVFHITETDTNKGIIIKQAVPYAKVIGESWPLTLKRAAIEANALIHFKSYCPEFVPQVYYSDEQLAITVMEDLSHLKIVRTGLIDGDPYPLLSQHIGEYVAKTAFYTSDYHLEPSAKKEVARHFTNPELCRITEVYIFTDPFFEELPGDFEVELTDAAKSIWNDQDVILEVAKLKQSFETEQESLLHGDLHTGSIFASETETKVIDAEFAFYGPVGFDLGQYTANLLFQAVTRNGPGKEEIFTHLHQFWNTFEEAYTELWNTQNISPFRNVKGYLPYLLAKFKRDAFGFAGCELIRRTIGLSHVADLNVIEDKESRIAAKTTTLKIGAFLIKKREELDVPAVIDALKNHTLPFYSTL
ncbi:S-methyl-5-thioribose kinase [Peribacillus simplex]|jgi:5-methylthioribose kinase|uniref:S-methyl-5-thioribose kinase n=1 Tax=Peribacillus simplex TaxID=1478 RepID=UPI000B65FEE8|nr:S-methyl-5-thioribose kinase [Peribacillus simplex]MDW7614377.1 S-methyl-5-thioribose kinase [Peribacillus simplex]SNT43459.1 5'-methylthioribose kinase [Bacillus sp. OK838]